MVEPIPEAYRAAIPYLSIEGAEQALRFYARAFGAVEEMRLAAPDGRIMHAEIRIGDARVMLAESAPAIDFRSPKVLGGTPVMLHLYTEDVDDTIQRALASGATLRREVADQFYGDRVGIVEDPYGHVWTFATRIEELTPSEIERRAAALHAR